MTQAEEAHASLMKDGLVHSYEQSYDPFPNTGEVKVYSDGSRLVWRSVDRSGWMPIPAFVKVPSDED